MSYEKKSFEEIQTMGAGDLVHLMLLEFKSPTIGDDISRVSYMQSTEYFWAYERLNEMLAALDAA